MIYNIIAVKNNNKISSKSQHLLEDKLSKVLTTDKQKLFLKNRMAGMNKRQAAIQAGYAPSTASIVAKRLTDKLSCNRIFLEECERQGLTVHAIVKELKRGVTKAMDPHKPEQPDNFNRRGYTDIALKLYGAYPPTKIELDQRKVEIQLTPEAFNLKPPSKCHGPLSAAKMTPEASAYLSLKSRISPEVIRASLSQSNRSNLQPRTIRRKS